MLRILLRIPGKMSETNFPEEYTPTLEADGASIPSSPQGPTEPGPPPSIGTPEFSPPSGFGPGGVTAQPRLEPVFSRFTCPGNAGSGDSCSFGHQGRELGPPVAAQCIQRFWCPVSDWCSFRGPRCRFGGSGRRVPRRPRAGEREDAEASPDRRPGECGPRFAQAGWRDENRRSVDHQSSKRGELTPVGRSCQTGSGDPRAQSAHRARAVAQSCDWRPSSGPPPELTHDLLSMAFQQGYLLRALSAPGQAIGGATGIEGEDPLPRPSELEDPTPVPPQRPPTYPEEMTPARPEKKPLLLDQGTQTEKELEEWSAWLDLTLQGKSVIEHGVTIQDIHTAVRWCEAVSVSSRRIRCSMAGQTSQARQCEHLALPTKDAPSSSGFSLMPERLPQSGGCQGSPDAGSTQWVLAKRGEPWMEPGRRGRARQGVPSGGRKGEEGCQARGTRLCARIPRKGGSTSPTSIMFWQLVGRDVRKHRRGPAGRRKHLEDCNDPCQRPWDLGNRRRLRGPSRKASSRRSCHSSCGHSSCDPSSCESTGFDSRGTWWRAGCSKPSVGSDDGPRGADCSYLWASPCKPQLRAPRGSEATSSATEAPFAHSTKGAARSATGGKIGANGPGASILFGAARSRLCLFLDYGKGLGDGEGNGSTADGDNGHLRRHRRICKSSNRSWPCFPRTARKILRFEAFCCKGLPL